MWGYIHRRVKDPHAADDLVAAAFLAALGGIGRYDLGRGAPEAWLYGIVRRKLAEYLRKARRRQRKVELHDVEMASDGDVQADLEQQEESRFVARILAALPAGEREVLVGLYHHRLSVRQIAARMARSPKAVENLLYRARRRFKEKFLEFRPQPRPGPPKPHGIDQRGQHEPAREFR